MTLFDLVVIAGTAELLALVWILTALGWPRGNRLGDLGMRGRQGRAPARKVSAALPVTRHPFAPRPEGESAPGG